MKITLNKIKRIASESELATYLRLLNKEVPDDDPIDMGVILEYSFADALWFLQTIDGHERDIRHFSVWCAKEASEYLTEPAGWAALGVAERFADGRETEETLNLACQQAQLALSNMTSSNPKQPNWGKMEQSGKKINGPRFALMAVIDCCAISDVGEMGYNAAFNSTKALAGGVNWSGCFAEAEKSAEAQKQMLLRTFQGTAPWQKKVKS